MFNKRLKVINRDKYSLICTEYNCGLLLCDKDFYRNIKI